MLFTVQFTVFTSTFAHMIIAAMPDAETAGNIATLLFSMMLTFDGVLQNASALPGFWSKFPLTILQHVGETH